MAALWLLPCDNYALTVASLIRPEGSKLSKPGVTPYVQEAIMRRRSFLTMSGAAGVAVATAGLTAATIR